MPPLHSRAVRQLVKQRNKLEGPRSLHRGIHINLNDDATRSFKSTRRKRSGDGDGDGDGKGKGAEEKSHRDLLVHHQKIKEDLNDLYHRTSQLHKSNLTMEERIEESWRDFERIGGKVPAKVSSVIANARERKDKTTLLKSEYASNRGNSNASLCVAPGATPYAERLRKISEDNKALQERAKWERVTHGEAVDYGEGSALHTLKDRRIRNFQARQLKRAHMLRRFGDPTPLKQSGKYDPQSATFRVFRKTIRSVQREVAHDARVSAVKEPRRKRAKGEREHGGGEGGGEGGEGGGGGRSMWDVRGGGNINRPSREMLRYSREWEVGPSGGGGGRRRKRSRS